MAILLDIMLKKEALALVSDQGFGMLEPHTHSVLVCCSAGGTPAVFLTLQAGRMPGGRRRYEKPAFLHDLGELDFAARVRREKFGLEVADT